MMQYIVRKPLDLGTSKHVPGEVIEDVGLRNVAALIGQRYLQPIGDRERIDKLEKRVDDLEALILTDVGTPRRSKH